MGSTEIYTSNNLISTPNLMSTPQSAILGYKWTPLTTYFQIANVRIDAKMCEWCKKEKKIQ